MQRPILGPSGRRRPRWAAPLYATALTRKGQGHHLSSGWVASRGQGTLFEGQQSGGVARAWRGQHVGQEGAHEAVGARDVRHWTGSHPTLAAAQRAPGKGPT